MANEIVPISEQIGKVTEAMRKRMLANTSANKAFSSNVSASYPLLSIKGSRFTFRLPDGTTHMHDRLFLDVVLVDGLERTSKAYYANDFDPSATEWLRPDCWSVDGIKPDPSSPALTSTDSSVKSGPTCATCQHNVYGSKILPNGKKAFACPDHRRTIVLLPQYIGHAKPLPMVLRVPRSSLKNLKAHADHMDRHGIDLTGMVTRMSFVEGASFPQLLFDYVNIVDDQQYDWLLNLKESELVRSMLSKPDFENATQSPDQETPQRNEPLKPLEPMEPIKGLDQGEEEEQEEVVVTAPPKAEKKVEPKKDKPPLTVVESNLIELPDGRLFDPVSKQYVERPAPQVEMPGDPDVITLPDGKFFNTRTREYVESPAAQASATEAPAVKPKRKPAAKKAAPAEEPIEKKAEAPAARKGNGNGGVTPAPEALESILKTIIPS